MVYGIGARLDQKPEFLFLLRGVDHLELIAEAGDVAAGQAASADTGVVFEDINSIFEMLERSSLKETEVG